MITAQRANPGWWIKRRNRLVLPLPRKPVSRVMGMVLIAPRSTRFARRQRLQVFGDLGGRDDVGILAVQVEQAHRVAGLEAVERGLLGNDDLEVVRVGVDSGRAQAAG